MNNNFSVDELNNIQQYVVNIETELINYLKKILENITTLSSNIKKSGDLKLINLYSEVEMSINSDISDLEINLSDILNNLGSYIYTEKESTDSYSHSLSESIDSIGRKAEEIKKI